MTGWETKALGEILQLNYGKSLPSKSRTKGIHPVYGSNGIVGTNGSPIVDEPGLIIGRKGSAGQVHRSTIPFCPIDTTFYVTQNDAPGTDLEFLYYLLLHIDLTRITGDVGVPGLNREMAYLERIALPVSLPEQKKIAHILSTVQRAIKEQERIIQTTTELKKALMHKLFSEGLRNESQKQTEIGPVPESWGVVKLGEFFDTQLGKMLSQKARTGSDPQPYLRNKNVQWRQIDTTDLLLMDFDPREKAKFTLLPGDLLVCEGGQPGRAAIWRGQMQQCYYQKALHRLRPKNKKITNDFLLQWLEFSIRYQNTYKLAGASTIAHLPEVQLKALPIPLPSTDEQTAIVESLDRLDSKEEHHLRKRDLFQDLFRTLLRDLMTAKMPVDAIKY